MKRVFTWLIDKWLAGFITASFFFTAKVYYDLPLDKKQNFWNLQWIKSVLSYEIKLWRVFLIVIFLLLMFSISRWNSKQKRTPKPKQIYNPNDPALLYTVDTFGVNNATWTWTYDFNGYDNKIYIKDVSPMCPVCSSIMDIDKRFSANYAECSKCRLEGRVPTYPLQQHWQDVQDEILRRLRSNEYLKKINK